jgi:hypothetical protein
MVDRLPWRERTDRDSVRFLLRHQLTRGWRAAIGASGGLGAIATEIITGDLHQHILVRTGAAIVVAGVVAFAGGAFADTVVRIDRDLLSVTLGLRRRPCLRLAVLDLDWFAAEPLDVGNFGITALLRDQRKQRLPLSLAKREHAERLAERLGATLAHVRVPAGYRG